MTSFDSFTLTPMSAGDIIDHAVRLYKRNFLPLVRIVLAPSLVAYAGSILFWMGWRNFSLDRGDARVALTTAMVIGGGLMWVAGQAAFYAVLGGSSRALVAHFFDGRPILAREVYASVRERFWALVGATLMIALMILAVSWLAVLVVSFVIILFTAVFGSLLSGAPGWVQAIYFFLSTLITAGLALLAFLLVYSRVVYVPQVLMVERKGVFSAISRSFQLARGELLRIAAVVFFWIYVAWSVWVMMAVPVGWYAYATGVDLSPLNPETPLWLQIAEQTLTQLSGILIWPIAMLCFTLLYINSRVRKEGYDIELLANRVLSPPPLIPQPQPVAQQSVFETVSPVPSILGLNDYRPVMAERHMAPTSETPDLDIAREPATSPIAENMATAGNGLFEEPVEFPQPEVTASSSAVRPPASKTASKVCSWCATEAADEDRFCRVCGAVF